MKRILLVIVFALVASMPASASLSCNSSLPVCADVCGGELANYGGEYYCFITCWNGGSQIYAGTCSGTVGTLSPAYECATLASSVPACPSPPSGGGGSILNQNENPDDGTSSGGGAETGGCTAGQVSYNGGPCGYP